MFISNPIVCIILKAICAGYLVYFGYKAKDIEEGGEASLPYSILSWILLFLSIMFILIFR